MRMNWYTNGCATVHMKRVHICSAGEQSTKKTDALTGSRHLGLGKNPSHGFCLACGAFPFVLLPLARSCSFFGLLSPVTAATVRTTALRAKSSVGLFNTGSLHVGHVYCGCGGRCATSAARCRLFARSGCCKRSRSDAGV